MKMRVLFSSIIALGLSTAAQAAMTTPQGWYLDLGAGANWIEDSEIRQIDTGLLEPGSPDQFSWQTGYIALGSIGYRFNFWRVEFEVAYRQNDVDTFCNTFDPCLTGLDMDIWELSQMINVFYDLPLGGNWTASVGAGVGGNLVTFSPDPTAEFDVTGAGLRGDDYVLAGQLIAQIAYQLSERWELYVDYHFMFMDDPDMQDPGETREHWEVEKTDHALLIGVRFDLQGEGAPPPPPPPAAPPPPGEAREFIIFFGFNKTNLTAEAARVVGDAAAAAQESGAIVLVVGHTDTSGSQSYNQELSLRRADAVKAGLVQRGIPAEMISVEGKGEDEPTVNTGDGVKEPQNRRAVIILRIETQ